jgi:hypothetical protein
MRFVKYANLITQMAKFHFILAPCYNFNSIRTPVRKNLVSRPDGERGVGCFCMQGKQGGGGGGGGNWSKEEKIAPSERTDGRRHMFVSRRSGLIDKGLRTQLRILLRRWSLSISDRRHMKSWYVFCLFENPAAPGTDFVCCRLRKGRRAWW